MKQRWRSLTRLSLYALQLVILLFTVPLNAASAPVPVWLYDADNFEFWRDANGHYQGFYQDLIKAINEKYGYQLELHPVSGAEINQRFQENQHGLYAGVLRTEDRARHNILSVRIFDNEVVAASLTRTATAPEDFNQTRVIFRRNDATREQIKQRYPGIKFRELLLAESSAEAFQMLRDNKADFYINDDAEMDDTQHYYTISRPFTDLRIPATIGFSPDLAGMRNNINLLLSQWQQEGRLFQLQEQNQRDYLVSRIQLTPQEREWIKHNTLVVWLPKNENFAPLIWRDKNGYHGSAINMIKDMRELLNMQVDVRYVDNYVQRMRTENWPVRLVDVLNDQNPQHVNGMIGPLLAWHNAWYNRIDAPFIRDEEQVRFQRIGVLRNSYAALYLRERFGNDITLVQASSVDDLLSAIDSHRVDFILGDLSTLELSLRGNELFRGVLKVAGFTRSNDQIGAWVAPDHPLHAVLTEIHRVSSFRSQMERHREVPSMMEFSKNTLKVISVVLFITALFSLFLVLLMRRQMKQNRMVNRSIVEAMEKVNRAHDDETGSHIQRVSEYCGLLARALKLPHKVTRDIEHFASLHDVGKIAVPEQILRKNGPLTEEEFKEMKLHTLKGWRIIQGLSLGPVAENIIHYHHEKWDGSGYPEGLKGNQIPIEARILALADVYDALRQKRVYKPGYTHEHACEVILAGGGKHFDPQLIALFRQLHPKFKAIYDSHAD
ncbi:extracellular solute-binding protein (family 3) [Yokenella regensburgei]|uniref:Extracellular solute-binding protein (Family 3) n=1 Tax=Yokenella regensburgei TaxID=158877 RepID=A0ABX9S381_9ENTR|nr:HD domain-containing phosphohydrolase [Yokenella regensburgei]RKR64079.1 extracellular solute-binding protein (family 3) [Yokenella regensburgei]